MTLFHNKEDMNLNIYALTQYGGSIIGPIARLLGEIMNVIFNFLDKITGGNGNIGLAIILFVFIVYTLMLPLTIKQQKFSKLSSKVTPEIQAIQNKYKDKKDQESMMKMNDETRAVYQKYGISPTGGCLPMLIQLPLIWALYRVIYSIPAYVDKVKAAFGVKDGLVYQILHSDNVKEIAEFLEKNKGSVSLKNINLTEISTETENKIIDILYQFDSSKWDKFTDKFTDLTAAGDTIDKLNSMNSFLWINIAESPISNLASPAILIPILAGVTQWLNTKLMPQPEVSNKDGQENTMASSMKTMNMMMPLISVFFCFTLPAGVGLYWIAGSVYRCIQQVIINKYMDTIDIDELVKKNMEKVNEKRAKQGLPPQKISTAAKVQVKETKKSTMTVEEREERIQKSTDYYTKGQAKPGSLGAKANMVKQYNEKNDKKGK